MDLIMDNNKVFNILNTILVTRRWNDLYQNLNPMVFGITRPNQLNNVLAKVAELIVSENEDTPDKVKIILLKSLGNSCLNTYIHGDYDKENNDDNGKYCRKLKCISLEDMSVVKAACMFVHNTLKIFDRDNFIWKDNSYVCSQLLTKITDLECAKEALLCLLNQANIFQSVYEEIDMENKLNLLQIIHEEAKDVIYKKKKNDTRFTFCRKLNKYLSERFCKRSDLILKTKDTYLDNNFEPMEVVILLDILGVLTSEATDILYGIQENRSLLINCCYLLKSMHMYAREPDNNFRLIQKLSEVAPSAQNKENDLESHPAYGFKAGLIRVIGNMSYKNKQCQDIARETDTIPLLFDCCNIDARNPLIMQWTILAIRNLCEDNVENQKHISTFTKIGVMENIFLKENGLTLQENEDGKTINIVPLSGNR
ncbi:ataxin-10 isoform X3 [Polistes fuscatus]|uniref:ataxin-10 isoform X3 n=1 Tax=Polistes fuscatus TaxID=30207 RepID=UPI001CA8D020|nr:ataxin-10 isoform X3 [Polistes fuscatus]